MNEVHSANIIERTRLTEQFVNGNKTGSSRKDIDTPSLEGTAGEVISVGDALWPGKLKNWIIENYR